MPETKPLPSLSFLTGLLRVEAETGQLFWLGRTQSDFSCDVGFKVWSAQRSGKRADHRAPNGYFRVRFKIDGKDQIFSAHRIIWKMVHGFDPLPFIDHIDQNPGNNRIENLRVVTHSQNMRNRTRSKRRAAPTYVYPTLAGRFRAQITRGGVSSHLGTFKTIEEAQSVVARALAA